MTYRHTILTIFLAAGLITASICEGGGPPIADGPSTSQEQPQSPVANRVLPPTPIPEDELTDLNLSSPETTTSSFINLYNGIMPATPINRLEAICSRSTMPSFYNGCFQFLDTRLTFLKDNARNLKEALFKCSPPSKINNQPIQLKGIWLEKLSFFDGSIKLNEKNMIITLQQSGDEWKIIKIE